MRARDVLAAFPPITADTPASEAARLLSEHKAPGLIVVDDRGKPRGILPGVHVLRLAVPGYCQEDPALARVIDEPHADHFLDPLAGRKVADALPWVSRDLPVVDSEATVLEVAALMARTGSPLVAVMSEGHLIGAVTLQTLLERVVAQ